MPRRERRFDPLTVLERGYDLRAATTDWVIGVVEAVRDGFHEGAFVGASIVRYLEPPDARIEVAVRDPREPEHYGAMVEATIATLPIEVLGRVFGPSPFIGEAKREPSFAGTLGALESTEYDSIGFGVGDGNGRGLAVGTVVPSRVRMNANDRWRWFRIVAHLGAAMRLRGRFTSGAPEAEAIFRPDGVIEHLAPGASDPRVRTTLIDAVERLARARALRRTSPEEALTLFRALVDGRYSVVDWVDTDGRRFVVAHENTLPGSSLRALTPREAQVAERMIEGRSNTEIGYLLGLAPGTVNRIARDVLVKLGGARRADLPRLFEQGVQLAELGADEGLRTIALVPSPGGQRLWSRLSPAERDVVRRALAGEGNAAIAAARGVSTRTVANQLAAVYARFGVRGRIELGGLLGAEPDEGGALSA